MRNNALSGALGLVAAEAVRLEGEARIRQDADSAELFGEISAMLLAMADGTSSPLLEVALERLPSNQGSRSQEFQWQRTWSRLMVLYFMEQQGLTRYAACREVSSLLYAGQSPNKINSAAKELAKHLPASLEGFYDTDIGLEVSSLRNVSDKFLREELGREANDHEIFLLGVEVLQDWRNTAAARTARIQRLREAFGQQPGCSMKDIGMGLDGLLKAGARIGTLTPVANS